MPSGLLGALYTDNTLPAITTKSFRQTPGCKYRALWTALAIVCTVASETSCMLQGLVASIDGTMRESRAGMKGMDKYKAQLFKAWPKEDVQTWLASFSKCMQETQAAHDAALDAAKNKGQVCVPMAGQGLDRLAD